MLPIAALEDGAAVRFSAGGASGALLTAGFWIALGFGLTSVPAASLGAGLDEHAATATTINATARILAMTVGVIAVPSP
jgi:hypothetical protein